MAGYRLTDLALDDVDEICSYLETEASERVALAMRGKFIASFDSLAGFPGQGHRRSDLTRLPVVFFTVDPYLIVYQRDVSPIVIHAIFHGARDVKRLLKRRAIKRRRGLAAADGDEGLGLGEAAVGAVHRDPPAQDHAEGEDEE